MKAKFKDEITEDHLCAYCEKCYPSCNALEVKFGDGVGNDNIIECDTFVPFFMDVSNIIKIEK